MRVIPFNTEHVDQMKQSDRPGYLKIFDSRLLEGKLSFTCMSGDTILMCAGVIELWDGRYLAWASVSPDAKGHWKSIHKAVMRFYNDLNAPRVEADIDVDFEEAKRWAEHLGFKCETPCRKNYFPDGRDAALYARIGT